MSASSLRCLVLGRDPSGESHSLLTLLEPAEGIVRCLIRTQRGNGTTLPDLFDEGEVSLERAKDGGIRFARDYRLLTRRAGLARDHRTLERACRLASMLRKNPAAARIRRGLLPHRARNIRCDGRTPARRLRLFQEPLAHPEGRRMGRA